MAIYDKEEEKDRITTTNVLAELGRQKSFQVETNKDYSAEWKIGQSILSLLGTDRY